MEECRGMVFNIQRFSTHDGPGIRTTVFLKGCNLRCAWCHNPESWSARPQIQYFADRCLHCGWCEKACIYGVGISEQGRTGTEKCTACGACVEACVSGALKLSGETWESEALASHLEKDVDYYRQSGGGVTCSGGEPLLQPDFVAALFKALKSRGIDTALDTAGNVPFSVFEKVLPWTDLILLDAKSMDSEIHKRYTGAGNELILDNMAKLMRTDKQIHIRVPVISGVNDSLENMLRLREMIGNSENVKEVRLLPYHAMGRDKAASLNIEMEIFERPDEEKMERLKAVFNDINGCES